jgi:hypothetical protein
VRGSSRGHSKETTLQELLEGSKQYRVPLYQRTYSWGGRSTERLWADVEKLAEDRRQDPATTHFIGSVVLAPSPGFGPVGVQEFLVVDGQQRLTTLTLLLCAIRDHRASTEDAEHRQRIDDLYLTNKYKSAAERSKVVPTQADRPAYEAVLDATPQAGGPDRWGRRTGTSAVNWSAWTTPTIPWTWSASRTPSSEGCLWYPSPHSPVTTPTESSSRSTTLGSP